MEDLVLLTDEDFHFISTMLFDQYGIHLENQKRVMLAGRLNKRLKDLKIDNFSQYFKYLTQDKSGKELSELINRVTTNHSFFFREKDHFDFIEKVILPEINKKLKVDPNFPLRIWSAGCASGEEIYTLAILLREYFGPAFDELNYGLLGTDISMAVLQDAFDGIYPENKLQNIPPHLLNKYFTRHSSDSFKVNDNIRKMVLFKKLNLMTESFPFLGQFDFVLCRNVMIYFNNQSRTKLISSIHQILKPQGYLFIGHSETIQRGTSLLNYISPAIYQKGDV